MLFCFGFWDIEEFAAAHESLTQTRRGFPTRENFRNMEKFPPKDEPTNLEKATSYAKYAAKVTGQSVAAGLSKTAAVIGDVVQVPSKGVGAFGYAPGTFYQGMWGGAFLPKSLGRLSDFFVRYLSRFLTPPGGYLNPFELDIVAFNCVK